MLLTVRGLRRIWDLRSAALAMLVVGCGEAAPTRSPDLPAPEPRPEVSPGPLQVVPPTRSRFEGRAIDAPGRWGCAGLLDLDGDGRLDVVLASRWSLLVLPAGDAARAVETALPTAEAERFDPHNVGSGTSVGCASADFDGDGRTDIAITTARGGQVMFHEGALRFTAVPLPEFPDTPSHAFSAGAAAVDANGDGLPELYVGRNRASAAEAFERDGCAVERRGNFICGYEDRPYPGAPNVFLQNLGARRFAVRAAGIEDGAQSYTVGALDLDGDGRQDLFSCNDGDRNRVYRSRGDLTFEDVTQRLGLAARNHCMGIALGDLDGDGAEDLGIGVLGMPEVMLRRSRGFEQADIDRGFTCSAQDSWGTHIEDFDNDGDNDIAFETSWRPDQADLFTSCGAVQRPPELMIYRNNGEGYFRAEEAATLSFNGGAPEDENASSGGRVSVAADVNGDGAVDILALRNVVYANQVEPWLLHGRVDAPQGWLEVAAPRGSVVEVCVGTWCRRREMVGERSYGAMHPDVLHFGLGAARAARVRVSRAPGRWEDLGAQPSGARVMVSPRRGPRA